MKTGRAVFGKTMLDARWLLPDTPVVRGEEPTEPPLESSRCRPVGTVRQMRIQIKGQTCYDVARSRCHYATVRAPVDERFDDVVGNGPVRLGTRLVGQTLQPLFQEPVPPFRHRGLFDAELGGHRLDIQAFGTTEHHPATKRAGMG